MLKKESNVYLLAGREQFLKEKQIAEIKRAFLDQASSEFNFNIFYAGSHPVEAALESAATLPFLGQKRIVLLHAIENLTPAEQEIIFSYLKAPAQQTILILETEEDNFSQPFLHKISQFARVIICAPFKGQPLLAWLEEQAKTRGKKIKQKASQLLVDNLGENLSLLANALESLILYVGQKELIEAEDVANLAGPDISKSSFELFDAIIGRKQQRALQILDGLLKQGINAAQILGALSYKMIAEKDRLASNFFEQALVGFQQADSDIKTGKQPPRVALEILLVKLLRLI